MRAPAVSTEVATIVGIFLFLLVVVDDVVQNPRRGFQRVLHGLISNINIRIPIKKKSRGPPLPAVI